jgi:hypothetical protein
MAADKDYIDSIFRIITNVQILSALGAIDDKLAQSIYRACHAHRDAWDAYTQIIEEARAHYWNQEGVSVDTRDSYERRLAEKARGLHQPGIDLDRVIVELGKSLVTRRKE